MHMPNGGNTRPELGAPPHDLLTVQYDLLALNAGQQAYAAGVDPTEFDVAMGLLENVREVDETSAANCLRDVPRSLTIASVVHKHVPNAPVNERLICLAALTSDAGKAAYQPEFLHTSSSGGPWPDSSRRWMMGHIAAGYHFVLDAGLPQSVANADGEHHSLQTYPRYGMGIELTDEERVTRDILAAADFAGAMLERETSNNSMLDEQARLIKIMEDMRLLFDDPIYEERGRQIVEEAVLMLSISQPEEIPKVEVPSPPAWKAIGLVVVEDGVEKHRYSPEITVLDEGMELFTMDTGMIVGVVPATV